MKRSILITFLLFTFSLSVIGAPPSGNDFRSEAEQFIRQLSKIRSPQINYSYISLNMIERMFSMFTMLEPNDAVSMNDIRNIFSSMRSMRRFETTGPEGYKKLRSALEPFLSEDDVVKGMELMTLNREDNVLSLIYSDTINLLLITDDGNTLSLVFIVGLPYEAFKDLVNSGCDIGF